MRNCAIIHPLHLELETATQLNVTQQTVVGGVPGKVFADTIPGSHFQLTHLGNECHRAESFPRC